MPRLAVGGGVPLLLAGGVGDAEARDGDSSLPHSVFHPLPLASLAFSSLLLSNAARYRSYPSRNPLSTRDEKINSPRGFVDGGMVAMIVLVDGRRMAILDGGALTAMAGVDEGVLYHGR